MRVHSDVPKAVVFVGHRASGSFLPVGTGFLLGYPYKGFDFCFVVTADHVLDLIPGDEVSIRLNLKSGGVDFLKASKSTRLNHRKSANDIALLSVAAQAGGFDQVMIPGARVTYEALLKDKFSRPALGDEVVTVGLYGTHHGQIKNIPVSRIGHIAMMPDEPVLTQRGETQAYLVEVRSIVGLSGSPVFLAPPQTRFDRNTLRHFEPQFIPIGMMLGYHLVSTPQDQIVVPQIQGDERANELSLDERNTGLAVVVPFERILEMTEDKVMQDAFERAHSEIRKQSGFREAGLSGKSASPSTDANPTHREDFNQLLGAAVRNDAGDGHEKKR